MWKTLKVKRAETHDAKGLAYHTLVAAFDNKKSLGDYTVTNLFIASVKRVLD